MFGSAFNILSFSPKSWEKRKYHANCELIKISDRINTLALVCNELMQHVYRLQFTFGPFFLPRFTRLSLLLKTGFSLLFSLFAKSTWKKCTHRVHRIDTKQHRSINKKKNWKPRTEKQSKPQMTRDEKVSNQKTITFMKYIFEYGKKIVNKR